MMTIRDVVTVAIADVFVIVSNQLVFVCYW